MRLLDLYCGAGGAAVGYHRAGFDVVGVDHKPQRRYPYGFICTDALAYLDLLIDRVERTGATGYAAIHASPPCQKWSAANNAHGREYPDLIDQTRQRLRRIGLLYVIENVERAPLVDPAIICGLSVGLNVKRHRAFETNFPLMVPPCTGHTGDWVTVYGRDAIERRPDRGEPGRGHRRYLGMDAARGAMGVPWMTRDDIGEAVPPAYTELIGHQLMGVIR